MLISHAAIQQLGKLTSVASQAIISHLSYHYQTA